MENSKNVYDSRFSDALYELAKSLDKVVKLCYDEKQGDSFNEEILVNKLGHLWHKSLDEISYDIDTVADEIESEYKKSCKN